MPRRPPQPDCYDYVRRYYQVPAYIGVRVRIRDREGVLVNRKPGDQYVYILFDGDSRTAGPYHPTDVTYLVQGIAWTKEHATLMAAAPDLLEALQDAVVQVGLFGRRSDADRYAAVIARAKGLP